MTMNFRDPIVAEVHEIRTRLLEQYGGADGYAEHLRQMEIELGDRVVDREPRPAMKTIRRATPAKSA